jgi:hypothetical protein
MNIAEILRKCPKGTKLYSTVYGEVELVCVNNNYIFPISCRRRNGYEDSFTNDGRVYFDYPDAECVLFPSKDQRDWSKFGATDKETKPQFKPFDKVLVRDRDDRKWGCDFFCHLGDKEGVFVCISSWWRQCIPYEGNEHLLGTTKKPEE